MGTDFVRAEVGDEAQVERSGGIDGAGLPVRRAGGAHVDLLVAEDQRDPALAEDFAPHAEHPHVPVGGDVDIAAVEHHVVDAVNNECHVLLLRQQQAGFRPDARAFIHVAEHGELAGADIQENHVTLIARPGDVTVLQGRRNVGRICA